MRLAQTARFRLAPLLAGALVAMLLAGCYDLSRPLSVTITRDGRVEQHQPAAQAN